MLAVLLGAFSKLLQATITCVMPIRPPVWNNSALAERVFVKFYVGEVLLKTDEKIQTLLKSKNITELLHGLRTFITTLVTGVTACRQS